MVKLADTPDLGSGAARCGGSSPLVRTNPKIGLHKTIYGHFKKTSKTLFYYIFTTSI